MTKLTLPITLCALGALTFASTGHAQRRAKIKPTSVYASNTYQAFTAQQAFDGNLRTLWSSGNVPTQWIEADLGAVKKINEVNFSISITKTVTTTWEVWVSNRPMRNNTRGATLVNRFAQQTRRNEIIRAIASAGTRARYVQIRNTQSPFWTALNEVSIMGPAPVVVSRYPIVGTWKASRLKLGKGAIIRLKAKELRGGKIELEFFVRESAQRPGKLVKRVVTAQRGLSYRSARAQFVRIKGRAQDVLIGFFISSGGRNSIRVYQTLVVNGNYVVSPTNVLFKQ